jgi:hypothetical protein
MSTETITIRVSPEEVARLDELRGEGVSRSAFVRELLRRGGPLEEAPSYGEALVLLARKATAGKVRPRLRWSGRLGTAWMTMRTPGLSGFSMGAPAAELERFGPSPTASGCGSSPFRELSWRPC